MMAMDNQTPFETAVVPMRDKDWWPMVVVVAKATYDVAPGKAPRLASRQLPVQMADEFHGEPGASSPRAESDLALRKPGTDVLVVGSAHAGAGRVLDRLEVTLSIGAVRKRLLVWGDRRWIKTVAGYKPSDPMPFAAMPLTWERAFGGEDPTDPASKGWEARNPVGTGFRLNRGAVENHSLPNLESPAEPMQKWTDKPTPQGVGPVGRHWMPRRAFAGNYDADWERKRAPALPLDFDDRYFQAAPPDLVATPHLKGNEHVEATHLHPGGPLVFDLPGDAVTIVAHGSEREDAVAVALDTVLLLPEQAQLVLVWRGQVRCPRSFADLQAVQILPGKSGVSGAFHA